MKNIMIASYIDLILVFRRPNTNIWVTKKFVDLDDGRNIKERIAKCTVTELHLTNLDTYFDTIQLLAKWNTIKKVVLDNVDSKKCDPFDGTSFGYAYATAEDLISCFPNAEHIRIKCARRRSTPSDAMNQLLSIPWTSKIKSLFLEDVKKPIDGDLYFQFLKKHAAENASFGINFGKEAKNPQAGSLKRKFESIMSNDLELSIKRPKFEVSVYGDNILEFNQPRKSFVNCQRLLSQHFPFRKSLMDYIVKNNPIVLRKLQKTCKYFLIKHPYLIATDIWSDCNCTRVTVDGKQYWIDDGIDYFPKILVAKSLRFGVDDPDYFHKWMRRILRWDIPEIEFADTSMSYSSFKNVTKSQKVVKWNSLLANFFEDKKRIHISLDLMLTNLPNIVDFSIRQCHITSETTMNLNQLPWKNKIERLILYSIDGIFDPDSFYEFLVKALAPRAFLKLIFVKTLNQEKVDQLKNVLQYKLESWNPRVEKPKIMFDRFDHTTTYSSLCL